MSSYIVTPTTIKTSNASGHLFEIKFGAPAQNTEIVPDAIKAMKAIDGKNGDLALFNGPASLPVGMALGHEVAHLYGAIACFDPKLNGYVVCVSHDPRFSVGQLISSSEVSKQV